MLTADALFRRVVPAVVGVEVPDGSGSGVLLSRGGLIVTNRHVVDGWSTAWVRLGDRRRVRARVQRSFRDVDLAFLQLEPADVAAAVAAVPGPLIEAQAPPGRLPAIGERAYAIGHPLGLEDTITEGIIGAVEREIDGRHYIQVDASINPGNSGGPLYDGNGELIGINSCSRADSTGLNFAIPVDEVYRKFDAFQLEREQGHRHYCAVCGAASADGRYCDQCGARIRLVEGALLPAPAEAGLEDGEPEDGVLVETDPGRDVCGACGAINRPEASYCDVCGAAL